MINRRGFFGSLAALGGSVTVLATPTPSAAAPPRKTCGEQSYQGYQLNWSGWIGENQSTRLVGHWTAYPRQGTTQPYLVVVLPGFLGGPYRPGSVFNIAGMGRVVDIHTPIAERDAYVTRGYEHLIALVDRFKSVSDDDLQDGALGGFGQVVLEPAGMTWRRG